MTRERLYLETIERILSKIDKKTVVDRDLSRSALPLLQLGPPGQGPAVGGAR